MYLKKKSWSVEDVARQINALGRECSNPNNDGFTAFDLKKDLYQIKNIIETQLAQSPTFEGEQEWLHIQEQQRIIKILKS
jgi:ABC-type phosphate/phosphonate transport system ATPase subunit